MVAGGEVGEDELVGAGLFGDGGGLFGGEVVVFLGEFFVALEVGALAEEDFCPAGDLDGLFAGDGVDDDGKGVALADPADVIEFDQVVVNLELPLLF